MSWKATAWALTQSTGSASGKAVLLCLANYADADGWCWPSQQRLADETEQSVDTVQRRLNDLEKRGLITREHRFRKGGGWSTDGYVLLMPGVVYERSKNRSKSKSKQKPVPQSAAPQNAVPNAASERPVGTAPVRSEPSLEPKIESSAHSAALERRLSKGSTDVEFRRSSSAVPGVTKRPSAWRDRGGVEIEVAKLIGKDGWELLASLPDCKVTEICQQHQSGTLDASNIEELKINYEKQRSASP